ncbi:site-specific integrase [Pseudomonas aeruginosa]|uniref:site-specific integrase n=1 Tax=Pseudomonas aeruginosa TaxID=287 RepID=UPI00273954FD|nr:site-specific integrase [Pseudomonas aeruginosa]
MAKGRTFAKSKTQAKKAARNLFQRGNVAGLGTARTYGEGLKLLGDWMRNNGGGSLEQISIKRARQYLAERATQVSQSTLDRDRQAIQALLQHTGKLGSDQHLKVIQAERQQNLQSRAYTPEQVHAIRERLAPHNALGLEVAQAAGLRTHELFTLARRDELTPDQRPADSEKFAGRDDHTRYVVTGKGGLAREVSIPNELATRLEAVRLNEPRTVRDRGVLYRQHYAVGGGQALSQAFSAASKAALGYSTGIHGVRHSYAQQRHYEVQRLVGDPERALRIVSQEMGHFRPEITQVYLR